jgi:muconolactone delta-isomerase
MISRDRQRTSVSRKRTHKATLARQQQQAGVLQRLWKQAKEDAKAAA